MFSTTANKITLFRMILVPVFLLLAYTGHLTCALVVYIIASISDFADGYIARNYNQISAAGKFFDPLADKMLVTSVMCYFIDADQMSGWCVAAVLFRDFAVSGLRLIAVEKGRVIAAARSGKIKTAATMICLGVMMAFPDHAVMNMICSAVILITTVYSGIEYYLKNIDILKA